MKLLKKISLLLAVAVLAGCVTAPKPIYNWDNYQSTIYEYYKSNETPEQQIAALKETLRSHKLKVCQSPLACTRIWGCCMPTPVIRN